MFKIVILSSRCHHVCISTCLVGRIVLAKFNLNFGMMFFKQLIFTLLIQKYFTEQRKDCEIIFPLSKPIV